MSHNNTISSGNYPTREPDQTDQFLGTLHRALDPQLEQIRFQRAIASRCLVFLHTLGAEVRWEAFFHKATQGLWRFLFGGVR